jgi:hypothetical protein
MTPNEAIVSAWIADEDDEYTRCVLGSMVACCRNPNNKNHTGPLTPEVCRKWAQYEHDAASEHPRCAYTAGILFSLADKLHEES